MKRTLRSTLLALVLLALPAIAWAQAAPSPDVDLAPAASATIEAEASVGESSTPDEPLTRTGLGQDPIETEIILCGDEFTCRQICLDNCEATFNACRSGCGTPSCHMGCMLTYQECGNWCWITF